MWLYVVSDLISLAVFGISIEFHHSLNRLMHDGAKFVETEALTPSESMGMREDFIASEANGI